MKWIAITGSLRKHSFNTRLLRAMCERTPAGVDAELATLHGIPLYDGDLEEAQGIPEAVVELRARIKASDGLIIATPEYNAAIPGVLKNALDWLTRPGEEMKPTFGGRLTGLIGATPGAWGTAFAQAGGLINLRQLGCYLYPDYLRVSRAGDLIDEEGGIDESLSRQIERWVDGFQKFCR